jgi:hypothetical protein
MGSAPSIILGRTPLSGKHNRHGKDGGAVQGDAGCSLSEKGDKVQGLVGPVEGPRAKGARVSSYEAGAAFYRANSASLSPLPISAPRGDVQKAALRMLRCCSWVCCAEVFIIEGRQTTPVDAPGPGPRQQLDDVAGLSTLPVRLCRQSNLPTRLAEYPAAPNSPDHGHFGDARLPPVPRSSLESIPGAHAMCVKDKFSYFAIK